MHVSSPRAPLYHVGTLTYTRARLATLFFWLLWGDFCFVLMEGVVPSLLPLRLNALHGSNANIGLIMTVVPIGITMFVNPVISFRSDRFRSRWGRRIPFIVATLPFLVLCLIGLGFGEPIGAWLHRSFPSLLGHEPEETVQLGVLAVFMALFAFFNAFVNSVFWYLFNDVVPAGILATFAAWFRIVSLGAQSLYSFFVFPYAQTDAWAIFTGAALLYLVGFGLMCWHVKEGDYPPPPPNTDGKAGLWSSIKTYVKECHHPIYIYTFIIGSAQAAIWSTAPFTNFFYFATGLDMNDAGEVAGTLTISTAVFYLGAAWLADRFHPARVLILALMLQIGLASPVHFVWLFYHPPHNAAFTLWMIINIVIAAPTAAAFGAAGVLNMRIYPKTRYGQFCSANVIWRSLFQIGSGLFVGVYFDWLAKRFGAQGAYLWLPAYQYVCYLVMFVFALAVYVLWKRHGGDEAYLPPGFEHEEEQIEPSAHEATELPAPSSAATVASSLH